MITTTVAPEARSGRYGLRQAYRAERAKLFSIRSTWWTLFVTIVGTLAVTTLATASDAHHAARWYRGFDATNDSMSGLAIGALAIGVLGALVFTSEYGSGTIRSSMAATPRRLNFLVAKLLLVGALALGIGEVLTFSCFALGHVILGSSPLPAWNLSDPGGAAAWVAGSGVAMGLLGLMGAAIGAAVRRTAGAIGLYVTLLFLAPILLAKIGNLARFSPLLIVANSIAAVLHQSGSVTPAFGFVLLGCYTVVLALLGSVVVTRRDP